jgi:hypothetical protein
LFGYTFDIRAYNRISSVFDILYDKLDHKPMIKAGTCAQMSGFIQQVQGLARGGQITLSDALQLMNSAQAIQNALGC